MGAHEQEVADLSLLASVLNISDDELQSVRSRHKTSQGQALQLMRKWHSGLREQSQHTARQTLINALNAAHFPSAVQRLVKPGTLHGYFTKLSSNFNP